MSFYHEKSRQLHERFKTRALADQLYTTRRHDEFSEWDRDVIRNARMFFLATADEAGRPDCSIKGGDAGFVHIVAENALIFPDYDGNGMFRSIGNILANPYVGMLFVELEGQFRKLRINGIASVDDTSSVTAKLPGAKLVVRVTALDIFPNCSRYLPEESGSITSVFSPREGHTPPEPFWKSKPDLRPFVPTDTANGSVQRATAVED
ncbi:pyridoxamine 5'-phosphate oxidase family protein [Trinickia mobilis]|uniref:pyridoxamine 5'-phosphate oxidase family protein n=1 Tax=Trinickia mobilis TaxID=2816356 RepID=UPI001A9028A0|nr:pyridoxamine 5'-phosphate oxidase family protein [Trinickia mobilis]